MLLVLNATLSLVFLNKFVMNLVSFPMQVNVTHFCVGACVAVAACLSSVLVGGNWMGGLCGRMGKALLYMMLWIMFSSVLYSSLD